MALAALHFYQAVLSPALGVSCAFAPSCSGFAAAGIAQRGLVAGTWLGADRISRCHGFAILGGYRERADGRFEDPAAGMTAAGGNTPVPSTPMIPAPPAVGADPVGDDSHRFADDLATHHEWAAARTEYLRLAFARPDGSEARIAHRRAAACAYRLDQFTMAAAEAAALHATPPGHDEGAVRMLEAMALLHLARWEEARATLAAIPASDPKVDRAGALDGLAGRGAALRPDSPWLTGGLSAAVPGLGQIVAGYPWDGLSALLLTGASAAVLAEGLRRNRPGLAAGGAVLLAIWYPANIWGGANAARRAHRQARAELLESADARFPPGAD